MPWFFCTKNSQLEAKLFYKFFKSSNTFWSFPKSSTIEELLYPCLIYLCVGHSCIVVHFRKLLYPIWPLLGNILPSLSSNIWFWCLQFHGLKSNTVQMAGDAYGLELQTFIFLTKTDKTPSPVTLSLPQFLRKVKHSDMAAAAWESPHFLKNKWSEKTWMCIGVKGGHPLIHMKFHGTWWHPTCTGSEATPLNFFVVS